MGFVGQNGAPVPFRPAPDGLFAEEHVVLISSETHLQPVYPKINAKTVPSPLRNFSAPVILRDDLTSSERLKLLAMTPISLIVGTQRKPCSPNKFLQLQ